MEHEVENIDIVLNLQRVTIEHVFKSKSQLTTDLLA